MTTYVVRLVVAALLLAAGIYGQQGYGIGPGRWAGTWSGQSSNGNIEIVINQDAHGKLTAASVMFTYNGREVRTQLREATIAGNAITLVYEFDIDGAKLRSALKGTAEQKYKLKGTYVTTAVEGGSQADSGTFSAEAKDRK